jgi:hypothetical protein
MEDEYSGLIHEIASAHGEDTGLLSEEFTSFCPESNLYIHSVQ